MIHDGLDYADRIEERLSKAGLTHRRCDLTSASTGQARPDLAYVFTGGQTSVHSTAGWMGSAIDLTRTLLTDAERSRYSIVGICLGAQLIAEAVRPHSITASPAIEVGLIPITRPDEQDAVQVVPSFHYQSISPWLSSVPGVRIEWQN